MKRICMLLSMVMLLTSIIATPRAAVFADETSARADFFDTDANLGLYNQTLTAKMEPIQREEMYLLPRQVRRQPQRESEEQLIQTE